MSKFGKANIVVSGEASKFTSIPAEPYALSEDAAYLHYCANETVHGARWLLAPWIFASVSLN
jgi:phosphoserine aminotransferase